MELIDEKGRLFGRVNVVDALVVLVVLAVVAAGVALVTGGGGGPTAPSGDGTDAETRYATLALGAQPVWSVSPILSDQNVTLSGSSATVSVTDVHLTGATNDRVRTLVRIAYPEGTTVGNAPLRAGQAVTMVGDDYQTEAAVRSVGGNRSTFRSASTPVAVTATVDPATAAAVESGDRFTVGNRTLATVESVAVLPTNESDVRRLQLGVTLATRTVAGTPEFADRALRVGSRVPLRTNDVGDIAATVTAVGSLDQPGDPVNGTMTVVWEGVRPSVADALTAGQNARHRGATARITGVASDPSSVVVPTADGDLVLRDHPRLRDVTLTVQATARRTDSEVLFHGRPLTAGRTVTLDFDSIRVRGTVVNFESDE
ncbi:DUF4330 domain-containing protein [Halorientalis pallida]|uniref:DUF4330 domain-containing protein n=1 Tax=Halorientalis pallida TaxID=2479928 RepID=UPI003C6EADAC